MAVWDKHEYRPGLIFYSPHKAFVFHARPGRQLKWAEEHNESLDPLALEFAVHRGEFTYTDPDGHTERGADIAGNFLDLDSYCEDHDWSEEERELCAKRLLWYCEKSPKDVRLWSAPKAPLPWPTYDTTHHKSIPTLAAQLGLVGEALNYESQNKKREEVLERLKEALNEAVPEDDESLAAA